jgi:hypothetical protein
MDYTRIGEVVLLISVGLVTEYLSGALRTAVRRLRVWLDREYQTQIRRILGTWQNVTETFDDGKINNYTMLLRASGNRITGEMTCKGGPDDDTRYSIDGSYRDYILRATWVPVGSAAQAMESGALALRLDNDTLEGYGLYFEPNDNKIHAAKFVAKTKSQP